MHKNGESKIVISVKRKFHTRHLSNTSLSLSPVCFEMKLVQYTFRFSCALITEAGSNCKMNHFHWSSNLFISKLRAPEYSDNSLLSKTKRDCGNINYRFRMSIIVGAM